MKHAALVASVALGTALGALGHAALIRQAPREAVPTALRAEPPARVACNASLAPSDLAALRAELATLIDDRLGDKSHGPGSPQRPAAPQRADEPTAEAVAAATTASQVLDTALTQGTWKDADRAAFRAALGAMTDAQRSEATSRLLTALDEGHLHSEVVGPIL
jgi:hypothetical protein